jgi:A/G-specific adenine glycosylase
MGSKSPSSFAARVVRWQRRNGRHGLPWQGTRDAYRIWLSEVMLQQTQVYAALPYFERFVARYPTAAALAAAGEDDVLALWSGLGYYARARNLLRAARLVKERFEGVFPTRFEDLVALPGVGRSTAGAIAAFAGGERRAILDGNVRRVLARHAGIAGDPTRSSTVARLWAEAEARLPRRGIEAYTQGMMDLGADLCGARRPACGSCPVAEDCVARREERIAELPGRRARAAVRRRQVAMLVVLSGGEVLLEKRPASGIWGGLWSLPEAAIDADPGAVLQERYGIETRRAAALEPFEHAFTHFTLEVTPWRIDARRPLAVAAEKGTTWLALADIAGAALPSPVKKLLRRLADGKGGSTTDEHRWLVQEVAPSP